MQTTIKARLALAAASMAAMAGAAAHAVAAQPSRPSPTRRRPRSTEPIGRYSTGYSGTRRYPEQSQRQALRGQRRAQGGPGIVKNAQGHWTPRAA